MRRRRARSRAFTMLELIIVLVVLGLVVGITAPRIAGNSDRAKARQAARGLVDALAAERAQTIRSMAPGVVFVVGDPRAPGTITLVCYEPEPASDDPGERPAPPTGEALRSMLTSQGRVAEPFRALGVWSGVGLQAGEGERTSTSGLAPAAGLQVRTVLIDPTGRARLGDGSGGLALVAGNDGDTIWKIEFDPISGTPSARSD